MREDGNLAHLSVEAFALLGAPDQVYVRAAPEADGPAYALCAMDGKVLAIVGERELAFAVARQHGFEPVSVH